MLNLYLILSLLLAHSNALRFPLQARKTNHATGRTSGHPRRAASNATVPVHNFENLEYIVNITLGGQSWGVSIDTGSSDLWLYGNVPNTAGTGKTASIGYAAGTVNGSILTAPLSFAGYNVPDQAFIHVTDISSFTNDPTAEGYNGLVGLGPSSGSVVQNAVGNDAGGPLMDRIFEQDLSTQNYVSFMMSRNKDPTNTIVGEMSVSEPISGYESITSQTKLPVKKVGEMALVQLLVGTPNQHWSTFTDANGVLGPDGQPIKVDSLVRNAPSGTLVAVFDSGFTLPQVSRSISDVIYGRVQGAVYNTENALWTIPCSQELNLTFVFGGQEIPIHPLDISLSDVGGQSLPPVNGEPYCIGAFQPIGEGAIDRFGSYDLILGMGFLRNSYILLDYGDFITDATTDRSDPFIQLLALTDPAQAHADFVKARLNGVDTTGDAQYALLPAGKGLKSPVTLRERELFFEAKHIGAIVGGVLGSLAFIVGLTIWCLCLRKRKDGSRGLGLITKYQKRKSMYPKATQNDTGDKTASVILPPNRGYPSMDRTTLDTEAHEMKIGEYGYNETPEQPYNHTDQSSYSAYEEDNQQYQQGYEEQQGYQESQYSYQEQDYHQSHQSYQQEEYYQSPQPGYYPSQSLQPHPYQQPYHGYQQ